VRILLEAGADVAFFDASGTTALHLAAQRGHDAVVRTLLEAGADVDFRGALGTTALHFAAQRGHEAVVETLLRRGADEIAVDANSNTPLSLALSSHDDRVVDMLMDQIRRHKAVSDPQRIPDDPEEDDEDQRMTDAPQRLEDTEESFTRDDPPPTSTERHPKPAAETKHQNTSQARIAKKGPTWPRRTRQMPSEFQRGDMVAMSVRNEGMVTLTRFLVEDRKYLEERREWMYQLKSLYTGAVHERGQWFSEDLLT
jgi:hypothetical protein